MIRFLFCLLVTLAFHACLEEKKVTPVRKAPAGEPFKNDAAHRHEEDPKKEIDDDNRNKPRPNPLDGVALYELHCESCHSPLKTSTVDDQSLGGIKAAMATVEQMKDLNLTDPEIDAIVFALHDGVDPDTGGDDNEFDPNGGTPPLGADLYGLYCASCHEPLEESTKRDRSPAQIAHALKHEPNMNGINLTEDQVKAIAEALKNESYAQFQCQPNGFQLPAEPIRALSPLEYRNTLESLFGNYQVMPVIEDELLALPGRSASARFETIDHYVGQNHFKQYYLIAKAIANHLVDEKKFVNDWFGEGCLQEGAVQDYCLDNFLSGFATRIYRRPLNQEEKDHLKKYAKMLPQSRGGLKSLIQSMLISPHFLYHLYISGQDANGLPKGYVKLTSYELVSRLAYALWAAPADDELYKLAGSNEIFDADKRAKAIDRMLKDDKAKKLNSEFYVQWLELRTNSAFNTDARLLDGAKISSKLGKDINREAREFVNHLTFDKKESLAAMMSSDYRGSGGDELHQIFSASGPKPGLLWRLILANSTFGNERHLIHSGVLLRKRLLCEELPLPMSADINKEIEKATADMSRNISAREQIEIKTKPHSCAGCHAKINPLAFAGANAYDSIGRYSKKERRIGKDQQIFTFEVDTKVSDPEIDQYGESSVRGPNDLAQALGESKRLNACFASTRLAAMLGRSLDRTANQDACRIERAYQSLSDKESLISVLKGMVGEEFLYRRVQ